MTSTQERLTAKQGGAAEFLKDGKLHDAVGAVADMMQIAEATSDPIESFFGTHDRVATVQSKNTSFHVTGALATWNHNCTSEWLKTLSTSQLHCLLKDSVRNARRLKRETDNAISDAAAHKLKRMEKQAAATRASEKQMIHEILRLRHQKLFTTVDEYEAFCDSVQNDDKKVVKELQSQIRILNKVSMHITHTDTICHIRQTLTQVHRHPRKLLLTFTCMGKALAPQIVRRHYRVVLSKIEMGDLSVRPKSVLTTVMRDRHVFRSGTSINDKQVQLYIYTQHTRTHEHTHTHIHTRR